MGSDDRVDRFRVVYDEMYPRIVAFALRRARSREDALDVVSETFVVVWRRLDDLPTDAGRRAWVYGVARRVLANHYRSLDRVSNLRERLKTSQRAEGGDGSSFDLVHEALDGLRQSDREILTLVAWDDLDNGEIARILGTSEQNVAVRLHRARKRLGRELARLGMREKEISERVKSTGRSRTPGEVKGTNPEPKESETP